MSPRTLLTTVLFVALSLSAGLLWTAFSPVRSVNAAPDDLQIGVVDLGVVFKDYLKSQSYQQDLKGQEDSLEAELKSLDKRARRLADERDLSERGSPAWEQKQIELQQVLVEKRAKEELGRKRLQEAFEKFLGLILVDIEEVVKEYGSANDFNFILKAESGFPQPGEGSFFTSLRFISARDVLYYNTQLDITPAIVKILNNRYTQNTKEGDGQD